jgi:hypothetical protein
MTEGEKSMPQSRFQGGEIVRLRHDTDGVPAGSCGVLWGVYGSNPTQYEECFVPANDKTDVMFEEDDVEEVPDAGQTHCAGQLEEIHHVIFGREEK